MPVRRVEKVKGTEKQVEREQDGKDAESWEESKVE